MAADGTRPKRGARGLGMAPAADEAAERRRKLDEYEAAVAVLEERLGPSWKVSTLAEHLAAALDRPKAEPGTMGDAEYRLTCCEADLAEALRLDAGDTSLAWEDLIAQVQRQTAETPRARDFEVLRAEIEQLRAEASRAEPATAIDDTTPDGILALLDAAARSPLIGGLSSSLVLEIEFARDAVAFAFDLPLRDEPRYRERCREYEPKPKASDIERQADTLGAHDAVILLGLLQADVADLPAVFRAALAGRGQGEDAAVKRIAAAATALARKLTTKAGDF
jgi:hypothetical protein